MGLDFFFFFQAEDGIRDKLVTGVQTCALPISCAATRPFTPLPATYPALLREAGLAGPVRFRVVIDSLGRPQVTTFAVLESPNPAVRRALREWGPGPDVRARTVEHPVLFPLLPPSQRAP